MADINWKLTVSAEGTSAEASQIKELKFESKELSGKIPVDDVNTRDPEHCIPAGKHKTVHLPHCLNVLLLLPAFRADELSDREKEAEWGKVRYWLGDMASDCAAIPLRGPQFLANGATELLNDKTCITVENKSVYDLQLQILAGTHVFNPDAP